MNIRKSTLAALLGLAFSSAVFAQTAASEVQRDVNQQQRVEQGLQSGALTTREAARLERGEARIARMQANAMSDGKLLPAEKARIAKAQNFESKKIYAAKHNDANGNPQSLSSQRMQADVQRNVNQEKRIEQGIQSGALSNREVASLERGQARVDRRQARAGADGHVGPHEQHAIQHAENVQSKRIYNKKHNGQTRS